MANGIKLQNVYMTFGGTSWGWLPASVVYTSYDYGAAIDEARQLTPKIPAMKEMGYFLQAVTDIAKVDPAAAVTASDPLVKTYHLVNPDTGTQFYFARNDHTADLTFTLPVTTPDGSYTVPRTGTLQLNGKDMKVVVAAYTMDSAHLVYTTSHLMTHAPAGEQDVALLASRPGDNGETVLRYPAAATGPAVTVDLNVEPGHRRPATQLHPQRCHPGACRPRREGTAAAVAADRRRRRGHLLAARHPRRGGHRERPGTRPLGNAARGGPRTHR